MSFSLIEMCSLTQTGMVLYRFKLDQNGMKASGECNSQNNVGVSNF